MIVNYSTINKSLTLTEADLPDPVSPILSTVGDKNIKIFLL